MWKIEPIRYQSQKSSLVETDENDGNVENVVKSSKSSMILAKRFGSKVCVARNEIATIVDDNSSKSVVFKNKIDVLAMSENVIIVGDSKTTLHFTTYEGKTIHSQPLPPSQGPFLDVYMHEDRMFVLTASGKCYVFMDLNLNPLIENQNENAIKMLKSKMRMRVLNVGPNCRLIAKERNVGILSSSSSFEIWNEKNLCFDVVSEFSNNVETAMWCSSEHVLALRDARTAKSSLFLLDVGVAKESREWVLPYLHQFLILEHNDESIRVVVIRCEPECTVAEIRDLTEENNSNIVFKLQTKPRHDCILLSSEGQTFFVVPPTIANKSVFFRCNPATTTTMKTKTIITEQTLSQARERLKDMPFSASSSAQGIETELEHVENVELVVACCLEAKLNDYMATSQVLQYALSRCKKENKELSNHVSSTLRRLVTFVRMSASLTNKRFREWNVSRWHVFRNTDTWNAAALLLRQCQFASISILARRHPRDVLRGDRLGELLKNVPDTPSDWINSKTADWNRFLLWIKMEVSCTISQDSIALQSLASWLLSRIERTANEHSTPEFSIRLASTFLTCNDDVSVLSSTVNLVRCCVCVFFVRQRSTSLSNTSFSHIQIKYRYIVRHWNRLIVRKSQTLHYVRFETL